MTNELSKTLRYRYWFCFLWLTLFSPGSCQAQSVGESIQSDEFQPSDQTSTPTVAANEEVAEFMRRFSPRGVMSDGSQPTPALESLGQFRIAPGLRMELVGAEPGITQPLFLSWDSRGRLWVVQYRQYQFPAGIKIVRYDQHLRAVFDRVPEPPPVGPKGEDVITLLTDSDGDGIYDHQQNVILGLNIATAVQHGAGGIWVLNPPYLLFYPDADGDGLPDASPQVRLSGFGLQDTHSVANSMLFGPDGWLYGANGSTTSGSVSSAASKGVAFEGQCIWRYHPKTHVFEIYAEGGGNTFSLEIDSLGRVFSGTNHGGTRGLYYPQGSYATKNWGKHGPLSNPYALGYFEHMKSEGDDRRFPQAFCIYEGGLLPSDFNGTIIAPNSLHNLVWNSQMFADGSGFRTRDRQNLLETPDRWFRPVYAGVGPEGAVYIADWYDTRLSHVSPLDDWHKTSGRIYRLVPEDFSPPSRTLDLTQFNSPALVSLLSSSPNKWIRQRAVLELCWREETGVIPSLIQLVEEQGCLEALWAIHGLGELTHERAERWLEAQNPHVRRWVIRLLGDRHEGHERLVSLAVSEADIEVRSQLAASAKRMKPELGAKILCALLLRDDDADDLHLPLMIWWGLEQHVQHWTALRQALQTPAVWQSAMMRQHIAGRLIQRLATAGRSEDLLRCAELIQMVDDPESKKNMLVGLLRAFEGRALPALPLELQAAMDEYQGSLGRRGLLVGLRQGSQESQREGLLALASESEELALRLQIAKILSEQRIAEAQSVLMAIACGHSEPSLQRAALVGLRHYDDVSIATRLVARMDSTISAEHGLRDAACRTLAARPEWAEVLLKEIAQWRLSPEKIPPDVVQQLRSHSAENIRELVLKTFGQPLELSSEEKVLELQRLKAIITAAEGDPEAGWIVYQNRCAQCHRLFGEGKFVGPTLDDYERGNLDFWLIHLLDPSAEIREGFQSFTILTQDGSVLTGMIEQRNGAEVVLRTADDQRYQIPLVEIEELRPLPTSLMPDDLLKDLSDQQIRDLLAYLSSHQRIDR